ncbi:hypothetical protein SNEBB_005877 [Seison nebaliae]|nr:hypothetical protein SNEBB_005877 [Seison nebaliae]
MYNWELEKCLLMQLGSISQRRYVRRLLLNEKEARSLITMQLMEYMRDGNVSLNEIVQIGRNILGKNDVLKGIENLIEDIYLEVEIGGLKKPIRIINPIHLYDVPSTHALYASHFNKRNERVEIEDEEKEELNDFGKDRTPGEIVRSKRVIAPNNGAKRFLIYNLSPKSIFVCSDFPLSEANTELEFDRQYALPYKLDIEVGEFVEFPSMTCVDVPICYHDCKRIDGFNGFISRTLDKINSAKFEEKFNRYQYRSSEQLEQLKEKKKVVENIKLSEKKYLLRFGPSVNDRIRLGDTNLFIRITDDLTLNDRIYFDVNGNMKEGMKQWNNTKIDCSFDMIITNVIIVDNLIGIKKGNIGIRDGIIHSIGSLINESNRNLNETNLIGMSTEIVNGEGLIATPGAVDIMASLEPDSLKDAILSGITTVVGGGIGPTKASRLTHLTSGANAIKQNMQSLDELPVNVAIVTKGNLPLLTSKNVIKREMEDQLVSGAAMVSISSYYMTSILSIANCMSLLQNYHIPLLLSFNALNQLNNIQNISKAIIKYQNLQNGNKINFHPSILISAIVDLNDELDDSSGDNVNCMHFLLITNDVIEMIISNSNVIGISCADTMAGMMKDEQRLYNEILIDTGIIAVLGSYSSVYSRASDFIRMIWMCADRMKLLENCQMKNSPKLLKKKILKKNGETEQISFSQSSSSPPPSQTIQTTISSTDNVTTTTTTTTKENNGFTEKLSTIDQLIEISDESSFSNENFSSFENDFIDIDDRDSTTDDNDRVLKYLAKYTLNPANALGATLVGSLERGRIADICLWNPKTFAVRPEMVIKGGQIVSSISGTTNGRHPKMEPIQIRKTLGSFGKSPCANSVFLISKAAFETNTTNSYGIFKHVEPISRPNAISTKDLIGATQQPVHVSINIQKNVIEIVKYMPEEEEVKTKHSLKSLQMYESSPFTPLSKRYFMF